MTDLLLPDVSMEQEDYIMASSPMHQTQWSTDAAMEDAAELHDDEMVDLHDHTDNVDDEMTDDGFAPTDAPVDVEFIDYADIAQEPSGFLDSTPGPAHQIAIEVTDFSAPVHDVSTGVPTAPVFDVPTTQLASAPESITAAPMVPVELTPAPTVDGEHPRSSSLEAPEHPHHEAAHDLGESFPESVSVTVNDSAAVAAVVPVVNVEDTTEAGHDALAESADPEVVVEGDRSVGSPAAHTNDTEPGRDGVDPAESLVLPSHETTGVVTHSTALQNATLDASTGTPGTPPPVVGISYHDKHYTLFGSIEDLSEDTPEHSSLVFTDIDTLYTDPLSVVFEVLRADLPDEQFDLFTELVLYSKDLDLNLSEDNWLVQEISLKDLGDLRDGFGFHTPHQLELRLGQNPRLVERFDFLRKSLQEIKSQAATGTNQETSEHTTQELGTGEDAGQHHWQDGEIGVDAHGDHREQEELFPSTEQDEKDASGEVAPDPREGPTEQIDTEKSADARSEEREVDHGHNDEDDNGDAAGVEPYHGPEQPEDFDETDEASVSPAGDGGHEEYEATENWDPADLALGEELEPQLDGEFIEYGEEDLDSSHAGEVEADDAHPHTTSTDDDESEHYGADELQEQLAEGDDEHEQDAVDETHFQEREEAEPGTDTGATESVQDPAQLQTEITDHDQPADSSGDHASPNNFDFESGFEHEAEPEDFSEEAQDDGEEDDGATLSSGEEVAQPAAAAPTRPAISPTGSKRSRDTFISEHDLDGNDEPELNDDHENKRARLD